MRKKKRFKTLRQFLNMLKPLYGKFEVADDGCIRHLRRRDINGACLCPIEALITPQHLRRYRDQGLEYLSNELAGTHAEELLHLDSVLTKDIISAADKQEREFVRSNYVHETRDRRIKIRRLLLSTLGLREHPGNKA